MTEGIPVSPGLPPETGTINESTHATYPALAFLYLSSARNRLRKQITRLRNPRYLIGIAVAVAYFYLLFFRRSATEENPFGNLMASTRILDFGALALLVTSTRWWLFGKDRSAIAFTPAEVHFLFPAPITRRALVHAKLLRSQGLILLNVLIWVIIIRGDHGGAPFWQRGIAFWLLFTVLSLHRLGATLVRVNILEHSGAGWKKSAPAAIVFTALLGAVAASLLSRLGELREAGAVGVTTFLRTAGEALESPLAASALWPARAVLRPLFATGPVEWLHAIAWVIPILLFHYFWVIRLDTAFEEAALEASQLRAELVQRIRSAQVGNLRSRKGKLVRVPTLRISGRPEVAVAWKNVAAALRNKAWGMQVMLFAGMLTIVAVAMQFAPPQAQDAFLGLLIGVGVMFILLGPMWNRYDLRFDLQKFALLRSYPLTGARTVAAEILGVTLLHSITVWSLMVVPVVAALLDPGSIFEGDTNVYLLLATFVAVPTINVLMFTIQNGLVLMFPAWTRLGVDSRGLDAMGQNLLSTGATLIVAMVGLVFPVGIGGLVAWLGDNWIGSFSLLLGSLIAAAIVALEVWPLIIWLGSLLERLDMSDLSAQQ